MKKLFLAFGLMLMTACTFTNNGGINVSECDSTAVDSVEIVDTLAMDSLAVDSVN